MFAFRQLSVFQFKNYQHQVFDFPGRIQGICGKNGVGKTNLLDALHYLCFTRSYFTRSDANNVRHGMQGFRLEGQVDYSGNTEKVVCVVRENGRKEFSVDGNAYDKFSQHIGRYPCVVIAPDDAELVTGDSRERRNFVDALLSQFDADYLQQLITYKKLVDQRNAALKQFAEAGRVQTTLLDVLDTQLVPPGEYIFNRRTSFLLQFLPMVKQLYLEIAGADAAAVQYEDLRMLYESQLMEDRFAVLLEKTRVRDLAAQRTTTGVHRDDLSILSGNQPFRQIASQGQRKSLLFALKLAEMDVLAKEKGFAPLLLLDDVFEKLDEDRITNLLQRVCVANPGQVFITDTHAERLRSHLEQTGMAFSLLEL